MKIKIVFLNDEEVNEVVGGLKTVAVLQTRNGGTGVIRALLVTFLGPLGAAIFVDLSRIAGGVTTPTQRGTIGSDLMAA